MENAESVAEGDRVLPFDASELGAALAALRDEVLRTAERIGRELELERRLRENPVAVLGVAAGAGFLLGGGLWPVLRPFVKTALRSALSPANLLAVAAALGASRAAAREEWERDG
jgi:hypothetical protein